MQYRFFNTNFKNSKWGTVNLISLTCLDIRWSRYPNFLFKQVLQTTQACNGKLHFTLVKEKASWNINLYEIS